MSTTELWVLPTSNHSGGVACGPNKQRASEQCKRGNDSAYNPRMHHPGDLLSSETLRVRQRTTHHTAADHGRHRTKDSQQGVAHHQVHHDRTATDGDCGGSRDDKTTTKVQVGVTDTFPHHSWPQTETDTEHNTESPTTVTQPHVVT